ncbi:LysR substrate-binding domain-containing protein [Saxibacter everestensis]|uniref:LysR substrate-binding domain-containing protein n=1 Tax=Saxibacter everestensis TaxID=2909229 RepID=A0ABY8QSB2_9MICO|nr:LysR substrate-binding domain-containing protein [Brevibacteriaceae bacterium ZFBP1038]
MELHQLRYLTAVVDQGSFTRAGMSLHISQSGVSAQLRQLERELGQPLIDRSGRAVRLTDAGEAVLPFARAALAAVSAIREAVDEVAGLHRGSVTIGMVSGCSIPGFLDALSDLHRKHPQLILSLIEGPSDQLQSQVMAGDLGVALVGYSDQPKPGLEVAVVIDESLVVAVDGQHPFADRKSVRLSELDRESVISLPLGTGIRTAYNNACRAAGLGGSVGLEASSPEAIVGLAVRGLGVAVLSESMVDVDSGLVSVPIRAQGATARLGLVWKRQEAIPAATRAVIEAMTDRMVG